MRAFFFFFCLTKKFILINEKIPALGEIRLKIKKICILQIEKGF